MRRWCASGVRFSASDEFELTEVYVFAVLRWIDVLFTLYSFALIIRIVLPMLGVDYDSPVLRFLVSITEPLLAPLRSRVRPVGGLDFTPMLALMIIWMVQQLLSLVLRSVF